jgi:AraC family transcriptional regulator
VNYLEQVQRGIDYIEEHLDEEVQPAEVASAAALSQWHFQRIFKALTNETLKTYIRSRRFSNAVEKLAHGKERIIDIALAAGFETQESFTRAFKAAFGTTPADYRRRQSQLPFLRKIRFDADYLKHLHAGLSLEPEIYEQPAATFVGMSTHFYGSDSDKNNLGSKLWELWGNFLPRMPEILHSVGGVAYGVIRQTRGDLLEYSAALQVDPSAKVPQGMVSFEIPPTRYARFTHRGLLPNLDQTVNYIYSSWLLRSDYRHTYGCDLEFYGPDYLPDSEDSIVYYAIPIE